MKYHKVTVTLKNGFTYSYTCISRMLPGMKAASQSYWTESIVVEDISKEDYDAKWSESYKAAKEKPVVHSIEELFNGTDDRPSGIAERSGVQTKKKGRNKKTDSRS